MAKKNVSTVVSIGTTYTSQHLLTEHQEIHHFLDAAYKIEERAELDTDSFEQSLKAQGGAV